MCVVMWILQFIASLKPDLYILVDSQQELFDNNTILSVFSITYFDLDIVPRESGIVFYYINLSCIIWQECKPETLLESQMCPCLLENILEFFLYDI